MVQRTAGNHWLQRHAIQEFHGYEGTAVLLANVVNRADVGMVQCGCGLGFALKTGECLRVTGNLLGQELEGDEAMQPRILGLVDNTHTASAQLLDDAVVRNGLADHAQACYGGSIGKSMKAVELAVSQKGCWRKTLVTQATT